MPCDDWYEDDLDDEPTEPPLKEWSKKALRNEVKALRDQVLREKEETTAERRRRVEMSYYAKANDRHTEVMRKLAELFAQGNWRAVDMMVEATQPPAVNAHIMNSMYETLVVSDPWGKVTIEVRQCPPKPEGV